MESFDPVSLIQSLMPLLSYLGWPGMAIGVGLIILFWLGRWAINAAPSQSAQDTKPWPPKDHRDFWDDMSNKR